MNKIIFYLLLLYSFSVRAQNVNSSDSIVRELEIFLLSETSELKHISVNNDCVPTIHIHEIISNKCDLNIDFGVFVFESTLLSEACIYYLIKFNSLYYIFSAKDPMLVTNKLIELQELFPEEIDIAQTIQYIKIIGKTPACNMTNYMIVSRPFGRTEYIYAVGRYR